MRPLTMADLCPGHGGQCTCHPDYDCELDHGVVSYCDGTCAEARLEYCRYLDSHRGQRPEPATDHITLEMLACDGSAHWLVTFHGPDAEVAALAYLHTRRATHVPYELAEDSFSYTRFPRLADYLNPTCEHGLSAHLCFGPAHYASDAEIAQGW